MTEQKAAADKQHAEELERQRQIAEAQARAEEARRGGHHADAAMAAKSRKLKLAGIGVAAPAGRCSWSAAVVLGAASSIANRYNSAPVDTAFDPNDEVAASARRGSRSWPSAASQRSPAPRSR